MIGLCDFGTHAILAQRDFWLGEFEVGVIMY
jgi:hypothetical protein